MSTGDQGRLGAGADHRRELRERVLDRLPARRVGGDLRVLLAIMTATIRLCFGMARDDTLPGLACAQQGESEPAHASAVHRDRPTVRDPIHPVRRRCDHRDRGDGDDLSELPDRNLALLRARLNGWPKTKAPFSLGKWGYRLTFLAIAWAASGMLVNIAWRGRRRTRSRTRRLMQGHLQLNLVALAQ